MDKKIELKDGELVWENPKVWVYYLKEGPEAEKEWNAFEERYGREVEEARKKREALIREFDRKYGDIVITF